ncbi:uncharacterized protein At4g00950 [Nicotiana tabacum]|uniref:Uncharacterized protein At4g00950 n=2 Tax=Nicotiana TaxID=4085 RepID=A0A1S3YM06_TOBAC|nr:PREDICTED: uncharacterized protein At4g00950-like [Nicotiana sylvestris]XP_016452960.1 PREDICTED: uncharacterized protein At4g00950-like [Nicotiana tabacum]
MGTDTEAAEMSSTLKLPLFSVESSQEDLGMLTPLHTLASIPFKWEEEPGKPRPCTDLIPLSNSTCLEPPPRLYNMEFSKTSSSPTTVFDGPYITSKPKFSSFRLLRKDRRHRRQGSFDSSTSSETGQLSTTLVLGNKKAESKSWWRRPTNVKHKGCDINSGFVFPSSIDSTDCVSLNEECSSSSIKTETLRRSGSFSGHSQAKTHIWVAIYEGFKQVIPWKSRKSKKEALIG